MVYQISKSIVSNNSGILTPGFYLPSPSWANLKKDILRSRTQLSYLGLSNMAKLQLLRVQMPRQYVTYKFRFAYKTTHFLSEAHCIDGMIPLLKSYGNGFKMKTLLEPRTITRS